MVNSGMTAEPQQYVVYYRVSTQKQGISGLGLEAQRASIQAHFGASLIGEFVEVESGGKANRKELEKAAEFC